MLRSPFTGELSGFVATNDMVGTLPYTMVPVRDHPYASNVRSAAPPPITGPLPATRTKAGVPRQVTPAWWGAIGASASGPGASPGSMGALSRVR